MRRRLENKIQSSSESIKHWFNPSSAEKIDEIAAFICNNYCLAMKNLEEYNSKRKPPAFRVYIQWTCDLLLWALFIVFLSFTSLIPIDHDPDPIIFITFGIPLGFLSSKSVRIFMVTLSLMVVVGAIGRLIAIVCEKLNQLEVCDIAFNVRNGDLKGNLSDKYYSKLCFMINMLGNYVIKIFYLAELGAVACFLSLVVYSYLKLDIPFSMIIGLFVYRTLAWLGISALYAALAGYFLSVTYLKYRFKQVNLKIKECKSHAILMSAMSEHDQICKMNQRNNQFLKWILCLVYYVASIIIDLSLIQSFYMNNQLIVKLFFLMATVYFTAVILIIALVTASLSSAAHGSYYSLNSIIAKSSSLTPKRSGLYGIPKGRKMKIMNLIERLAQTEITVWCADLFPLNNNELNLFIAAVASSFFLFVDLYEKQ